MRSENGTSTSPTSMVSKASRPATRNSVISKSRVANPEARRTVISECRASVEQRIKSADQRRYGNQLVDQPGQAQGHENHRMTQLIATLADAAQFVDQVEES